MGAPKAYIRGIKLVPFLKVILDSNKFESEEHYNWFVLRASAGVSPVL
jgi:hypothetical protein